jgi:hypothetical protein
MSDNAPLRTGLLMEDRQMAKSTNAVNRRGFLKGAATAAAGAAALTTHIPGSEAEAAQRAPAPAQEGGAPPPTPEQIQRDGGDVRPPATARPRAVIRPG